MYMIHIQFSLFILSLISYYTYISNYPHPEYANKELKTLLMKSSHDIRIYGKDQVFIY